MSDLFDLCASITRVSIAEMQSAYKDGQLDTLYRIHEIIADDEIIRNKADLYHWIELELNAIKDETNTMK